MININRYQELAMIQRETLLTLEEQEEMIAISTEILNKMLSTDIEVQDILKRLSNR